VISVTLSFANGVRKDVLLSGVPRVGEQIRLRSAQPNDTALLVQHVVSVEGGNGGGEPEVVVAVRPADSV